MGSDTTIKYNKAAHTTFEDLFENALIGLHIVGADGLVVRANRADRAPVGLADLPQSYIGHHIGEFHAEDPVVEEILENLLNNKSLINYAADLKATDGMRVPVNIYSNSKMNGDEFLNTRCYTKAAPDDLMEFGKNQNLHRIPADELIAGFDAAENKRRFEALLDFFENGLVSVHTINADGIITWANMAELKAMGYDQNPEEYIGHPVSEFYADAPDYERMINHLVNDEPLIDFETRLIRRDGTIYTVDVCSNARMENGKFINSRCFTYPASDKQKVHPPRFTWPRNEKMFE